MSCSGETVEQDNELIQIKPGVLQQLKKAKYGVADHSTVELCHWTKNLSKMKVYVTNISFMEFQLTDAWNFLPLVCIVKIDVSIVGDQWSFMIH